MAVERDRPNARNKESRIAEIQVSDMSFLGGRGGGRKAERERKRGMEVSTPILISRLVLPL